MRCMKLSDDCFARPVLIPGRFVSYHATFSMDVGYLRQLFHDDPEYVVIIRSWKHVSVFHDTFSLSISPVTPKSG